MVNNLTIRNSTPSDFDWIKALWYKNRDTLSIPFTRCINELCSDKNCYVVEIDGKQVAVGRIHFAKRLFELRIEHLVVDEDFRGKGIGTTLLKHLVASFELRENTIIYPEIVACAVVGAKNNAFYEKFAIKKSIINRKTRVLYRYVLDRRRLCV